MAGSVKFISSYDEGDFDSNLAAACTDATASNTKYGTVVIDRGDSDYSFTGPYTVSSKVSLVFQDGIIDTTSATGDLTINGPIQSASKQIFKVPTGTSGYTVKIRDEDDANKISRYVKYVNPLWFGTEDEGSSYSDTVAKAQRSGGNYARILSAYSALPLINIEDYGCISYYAPGGKTFDNQPIIQGLIDRMGKDLTGTLFFPGKGYVIKDEIYINQNHDGIRLQGCGGGEPISNVEGATWGIDTQSVLLWKGDDGGTMLRSVCHGMIIDGLHLCGCVPADDNRPEWADFDDAELDHAGIGWHIDGLSGSSSGGHHVYSITVEGCDKGIEFGGTANLNSDQTRIGMIWIRLCNDGIYVGQLQSVGISVGKAFIIHIDNYAFNVEAGRFSLDSTEWTPTVDGLLRVKSPSANTIVRMSDIQIDPGTNSNILCDASEVNADVMVVFRDCRFPGETPTAPMVKLGDHCKFRFENCQRLRRNMVEMDGLVQGSPNYTQCTSNLTLDGCAMDQWVNLTNYPASIVDQSVSTPPWYLRWMNCTDRYGNPLPDGCMHRTI